MKNAYVREKPHAAAQRRETLLYRHLFCLPVLALVSAAIAAPKTIYVDKNVSSSGDGTSWASAFKTIQEGVNAASTTEVDTVLVAPGEYGEDQGYTNVTVSAKSQNCRVWITKKLILKSRDGKETTHIIGRRGNGSGGNDASGNEPVMCVLLKNANNSSSASDAAGTIVEGFTIRDGEMSSTLGSVGPAGVGNPFSTSYSTANSNLFYVAYCTISNCCAQRRSAMRGGTAIGTLFTGNTAWGGNFGQSAGEIYAYNCIFAQSTNTAAMLVYTLVNCTVCNNAAQRGVTSTSGVKYYNVASFDNGVAGDSVAGELYTCVFDGTSSDISAKTVQSDVVSVGTKAPADTTSTHSKLCMAACAGDFRPVDGGYLYGLDGHYGRIEYTNLDFIPPEYKQRDFYGNRLADDAVIPIGVILPAATPAAKPLRIASANVSINGWQCKVAGQFVNTETVRDQIVINPVCEDGGASVAISAHGGNLYYPRRDGTYLYMFGPQDADSIDTLTHYAAAASGVRYVDRTGGLDTNDGLSSSSAFQSIQAAVDSLPTTGNYVIKVAEGTYDNESGSMASWVTGSPAAKGRIVVDRYGSLANNTSFYLLLWATGDRDDTVIEGALENDAEDGIGENALRCIVFNGKISAAPYNISSGVGVSGFTLRKGRPTGTSTDTDCRGGSGGAALARTKNTLVLQDCTLTENLADLGSAGYYSWFVRCRFYGNVAASNSTRRTVIASSTASSCLFENNPDDDGIYGPGYESKVYNCTLYDLSASSSAQVYVNSANIYNSVLWSSGRFIAPGSGVLDGNIFWCADASQIQAESGYVRAAPRFADAAAGDFRINWNSPAWEGGTAFSDDIAANVVGDYFGNPIKFTDDGKVVIGAVHAIGKGRTGFILFFQ